MRTFLKAESFYLRKDTVLRTVCLILLAASVGLVIWIRSAGGGRQIENLLEPFGTIMSVSLLLYFILPFHTCFFSTEGFESGTIKNVIASGTSRSHYFFGKFVAELKIILWAMLQFYAVYLIVFYLAALASGADIGHTGLAEQAAFVVTAILYNVLYLTAYAAVVLMIGFIVWKTAIATILSFAFIFGNLLIYGYGKDSVIPFVRTISEYSLMTQIFKFSGIYVENSQQVMLTSVQDHLTPVTIPCILIVICLLIGFSAFKIRDIQTD